MGLRQMGAPVPPFRLLDYAQPTYQPSYPVKRIEDSPRHRDLFQIFHGG